MYKRYSIMQVKDYGINFIRNLEKVMKNERVFSIRDFIRSSFILGNEIQYWDGSEPVFRIIKSDHNSYALIDEKEKIELYINDKWIIELNTLFRHTNGKKNIQEKNMIWDLFNSYDEGNFRTIQGKNFIVYDIETLLATSNLRWTQFQLWYSISSADSENHDRCFKYIEKENLKRYVDYLLDYDGWIVWFNHVWFDNIIICYSLDYTQKHIDILNQKSLDIFYYIRNLTWKRIGLNKVSSALIGLDKVLAWWWAEWSELLKKWLSENDEQALKKVKEYCKWDVKMTLGILLYLMEHKEFYMEGKKYIFDESSFIELANDIKKNVKLWDNRKHRSLF